MLLVTSETPGTPQATLSAIFFSCQELTAPLSTTSLHSAATTIRSASSGAICSIACHGRGERARGSVPSVSSQLPSPGPPANGLSASA
jgi:hypothetical protein